MHVRISLRFTFALLFTLFLTPAFGDGPADRATLRKQVEGLYETNDFAALEKMAGELRDGKARFPEGLWKLARFYAGFEKKQKNEAEWRRVFERLDAWKTAFPDSITEPIVRADVWTDYAWDARGSGWANTVTPAGWKLFEERIAQSRAVLEAAAKKPKRCPHWYRAMETVALAQGWERPEFERLFAAAMAAQPDYEEIYFGKASYLEPRWNGEPGDWERFADEAAKATAKEQGMALYTRIAWAESGNYGDLFKETAITWPKMKQGFEDLEKQFPNSGWNLNNFAKFALMAGDNATAQALLARIGDKPHVQVWGSVGAFEAARRRVSPELAGKAQELATLRIPRDTSGARSIAFSPDGRQLAAGYGDGTIVVWDVATRQSAWMPPSMDAPVGSLAFAPSGNLLAAASGATIESSVGTVTIWSTATHKEKTNVGGWKGMVSTVRFSPDGTTLAMVGGPWMKRSEARLLDLATGALLEMDELNKHTHALTSAAISPDSRLLAVDCNRSINVWDLAERKALFQPGQILNGWVYAVDFSPDGKWLAAGKAKDWMTAGAPGGVVLWEVPGFKEHKPGIETPTGGIGSVAFSPDSKSLIAGGQDHCVRVWEVPGGKELATYFGHGGNITRVAVSPDGKMIASASMDGTVRLWPMPVAPAK